MKPRTLLYLKCYPCDCQVWEPQVLLYVDRHFVHFSSSNNNNGNQCLVTILNTSIYIFTNLTLITTLWQYYLQSPFYRRVDKSTLLREVRKLPNITQPGFKSRQSLVSESTLLILDESVFIPWLFIMWAQPPYPSYLANTSSYETNLALLPLWTLSSPPVK